MKDINRPLKFDRVNSPIGVSGMVVDHLEHAWSLPSPRFRAWVLSAKLCNAEGRSNFIDDRPGESQQVVLARSGPEQRLLAGDPLRSCHVIIPVLGYLVKRSNSSNILVEKDFRDRLPKDAGDPECQPEVWVNPALFYGVDGLACHAHLGGELCLGPFPFSA